MSASVFYTNLQQPTTNNPNEPNQPVQLSWTLEATMRLSLNLSCLFFCLFMVIPAFATDPPTCEEMIETTAGELATCNTSVDECEALVTSPYLGCVYDEDRRRVEWNPTGGGEDGADGTGACECRPGTKEDPTMAEGERLRCVVALSGEERCSYYGLHWDAEDGRCMNLTQYAEQTDARLVCLEDADARNVAWNTIGGGDPDSEDPGPGACECAVGYIADPELPAEAALACVLDPEIDEATCDLVDGYKWFQDQCMERWVAQGLVDSSQDANTRTAKKRGDDAHTLATTANTTAGTAKRAAEQVGRDLDLYSARDIKVRLGVNLRLRAGLGVDELGADYGFTSDVSMPDANVFPVLYFGLLIPTGVSGHGTLELGGFMGAHTGFTGGGNLLYLHRLGSVRLGGGIDLAVSYSHAFGGNFPSWEVRCWMPKLVGVVRIALGSGFELKFEAGGGPDVVEFFDDRQNTGSFMAVAGIEVALP